MDELGAAMISVGAATIVLAVIFNFHWFSSLGEGMGGRVGWFATGCLVVGIAMCAFGNHLYGQW